MKSTNSAKAGRSPSAAAGVPACAISCRIRRIVIFPISTLLAATAAMRRILHEIAQAGTPAAALGDLPTFAEFVDFIGLPEVRTAEQRYT